MTDEELVEAHWGYVEELLIAHAFGDEDELHEIALIGFHYKTAMLHGIKHGRELAQQEV